MHALFQKKKKNDLLGFYEIFTECIEHTEGLHENELLSCFSSEKFMTNFILKKLQYFEYFKKKNPLGFTSFTVILGHFENKLCLFSREKKLLILLIQI